MQVLDVMFGSWNLKLRTNSFSINILLSTLVNFEKSLENALPITWCFGIRDNFGNEMLIWDYCD